jgi:signal transduction histidine kinase
MEFRKSRQRRRTLNTGALVLVPSLLLALRYPARAEMIALHLAWIAMLAWMAQLSGRGRFGSLPFHAAALLSGAAAAGVVVASGGTESPRFGFLIALPPVLLAVVPELPLAAALGGGACLVAGVAIIAAEGRTGGFLLEWVVLSLTTSMLSVVGAIGFRAVWARELEAQSEHARTLARLAESERRRARAERLALIARLAARLAHELANPLAAVKANVAWLADAPSGARAAWDVEQAVAETRGGVERIGRIATDLRQLAEVAPGEPEIFDVGDAVAAALDGVAAPLGRAVQYARDPAPRVVANRALLVQCVRHLVAGCASLAPAGEREGALRLAAKRLDAEVAIDLEPCGRGGGAELAGRAVDPAEAVASGDHAGLHLAIAAELARAVDGTLETVRSPDGAWRCRVRLPAAPLPS